MTKSNMKKLIFPILIALSFVFLILSQNKVNNLENTGLEITDKFFKAKVTEVLSQEIRELSDGIQTEQQQIKLIGLDGDFKNKEILFDGFSDFAVADEKLYQKGDKVIVLASADNEANLHYYITDYDRSNGLFWLFALFIAAIIIVGRAKGARSILSLTLTFLVIIKYIIPQVLVGSSPIITTLVGSLFILFAVIYLTEGINSASHVAIVSIFISLVITIFISWFFVHLIQLSGFNSEEMAYLVDLGVYTVDFRGLLLAGIIIGALGVLDDVVISQVMTVKQIIKANPEQSQKEVFNKAYDVGVSHINSMTNTLFLAYSGASLPLLILFISGQSAFSSWTQIINNEVVATEIVRTLTGSIGLILAVPIATIIAVHFFKKNNNNN